MKEFRNVTPRQLTLDGTLVVDPFQFTGSIDETQPLTSARIADGSLQQVPNGTYNSVHGGRAEGSTLPVPAAGSELGYAESTGANMSTNSTSPVDYPGLNFDIVGRGRPVKVTLSIRSASNSVANGGGVFTIVDVTNGVTLGIGDLLAMPAGARVSIMREIRIPAFTGTKTIKVQVQTAGSGTLTAWNNGAGSQSSLSAVEI